jgi:crotonobetainyl-CoA:carnitine CoA-transferase CaiB-like acyl-CoA transferase
MDIFKGLRVVELANVLAGPAVGMFFAELGAEVIKIENKSTGGDLTRKWKLPVEQKESTTSSYYHSVNWNKEILFLDLKEAVDHAVAIEKISAADLLITNFKSGDAEKFGMSSSVLLSRYPSLIIAEITGFDDQDRVAYDAVLQAETGFMSLNGNPGAQPMKMPVALIDLLAAHQLKEGILIALLQRAKTGKGCKVTASLYRSAIASLANQASAYLNTHVVPLASGSLHPTIAPYGEIFRCADGQLVLLAVGTDKQFLRLLDILKAEEMGADPLFSTNTNRVINRKILAEKLNKYIALLASENFLSACHHAKVPAAAIRSIDQVFLDTSIQSMVLEQQEDDGSVSKRVATVAFKIENE